MGLYSQSAEGASRMDQVVAEIFATMMGSDCLPMVVAGQRETSIFARVVFAQGPTFDCELRLRDSDADALVLVLTGRHDATVRGDVAGELCNMIAGGWMNRSGPVGTSLDLQPPETGTGVRIDDGGGWDDVHVSWYGFGLSVFWLRLRRAIER